MHVIVLGAGVVGVTTAYYLAELGCRVTVIDRAAEVASGASRANAGQLSYNFSDSLAAPEFLQNIPRIVAGRDPGSKIRLSPGLISWGSRFVSQCSRRRSAIHSLALLKTARRSAQLMSAIQEKLAIDFSFRQAGKLVLLTEDGELRSAERSTPMRKQHGSDVQLLAPENAMTVEPALRQMQEPFCAALYSRSDKVADAHRFVVGLKKHLETFAKLEFRLATVADKLLVRHGRIMGVDCGETLHADAVVVALGAWSGKLLRPVGINLPICPVRGYSITLPPGPVAPSVSVTSLKHRLVFSQIDGRMRIAGFADFKGFEESADRARLDTLFNTAKALAPEAADYSATDRHPWGGFRPMTPSGRPCVGETPIRGLYVNTGHGMLGWTLACASGQDAANAVTRVH